MWHSGEKVFKNILIHKHHCTISQFSFKENNLALHMIAWIGQRTTPLFLSLLQVCYLCYYIAKTSPEASMQLSHMICWLIKMESVGTMSSRAYLQISKPNPSQLFGLTILDFSVFKLLIEERLSDIKTGKSSSTSSSRNLSLQPITLQYMYVCIVRS